jgi:S1-C subfamily serine protease
MTALRGAVCDEWKVMDEPSASNTGLRDRAGHIREKLRGMLPFVSGILAALLALILYNFLFPGTKPLTQREVSSAIAEALASATPRPAFSVQVYRIIQPSLVLIQTDKENAEGEKGRGLGTGVIVDDMGSILTSLHVVKGATRISLTFADGTRSEGFVEIEQPENDIAVLRAVTMPQQYAPATLGNPGSMRVGDDVYVVGNPFGLYGSMSAGVISGFDRTFQPPDGGQPIGGLIQFDAAANPGNSGGPLLNRNGHVIGIVMGIVNPTDDSFFVGIGFAVPIGTAAGGLGSPPY